MDEFGSPIAGGIRAVRRSVSSGVFRPIQRPEAVQAQPDSITTNLLSQNSLTLTSISRQLQTVSQQVASLNFSLNGIKENLAISDRLERQREIAKQNRERILAEQGLREGKESELERKIQNALTSPLRRVAAKTRGILARLQDFFLILAGGWLTSTGIDLLRALSDGNTDKIRELQSRFTKGLLVIGGIFTALQVGIGVTINLLARFVGTVARIAFGGLLKASLGGVRRLFSSIIGQGIASGIGSGVASSTVGRTIGNIGTTAVTTGVVSGGGEKIKSLIFNPDGSLNPDGSRKIEKRFTRTIEGGTEKLRIQGQQKGFFGRSVDKVRGIFGQKPVAEGGRTITKKLAPTVAKKGAMGFLQKLAAPLRGKGGFIGAFLIDFLIFKEDFDKALAGAAGFVAGAKAGAAIGGFLGAFVGGIGAVPGAAIGGIIGGLLGPGIMKSLYEGVKRLFGFGKKSEPDLPMLAYEDFVPVEKKDQADNINPVEKDDDKVASNISDMNEGQPSIINIPLNTPPPMTPQVSMAKSPSDSKQIPTISFDNNNPHTLFATATYGV